MYLYYTRMYIIPRHKLIHQVMPGSLGYDRGLFRVTTSRVRCSVGICDLVWLLYLYITNHHTVELIDGSRIQVLPHEALISAFDFVFRSVDRRRFT